MRAKFHDCFCTKTFCFYWPSFSSVGIVDTAFQTGTCNYAIPTGHLNFHFAPFAVSYEFFPRWNQRHLDFFSIEHKSKLQFFSEEFCVSYFRKKSCQVAIMQLIQEQLRRATLHGARDSTINVLKIAGSALQNNFLCISHHALLERGKNKTIIE